MAAKLKVFVTSDGLTDYVVAATSRPKALAAWGSHQDLFKTGLAHETDDPTLTKAATAQPDEVLRRPAGTRGELAKLKPARPKASAKAKRPSKAALKKVADLERRIATAEAAHDKAVAALDAKRRELDREAAALAEGRAKERKTLDEALSAARRALG